MEKNLFNSNSPDHGGFLGMINAKERLYSVPPAYFEGLAGEIMAKIFALAEGSRNMGYQVPQGYFEGFAGQVLRKIKQTNKDVTDLQDNGLSVQGFKNEHIREELSECAPLLLNIGNRNVYQVPSGYFDRFPTTRLIGNELKNAPSTEDKETSVVAITPMKKFWRTAVAAAAILGVLFSGERYLNHANKSSDPNPSSNQYAATIQDSNANFQQHLSGLSDLEIVNYLKTPEPTAGLDSISEKAAVETQKAISGMTNEELETYLERTPATY